VFRADGGGGASFTRSDVVDLAASTTGHSGAAAAPDGWCLITRPTCGFTMPETYGGGGEALTKSQALHRGLSPCDVLNAAIAVQCGRCRIFRGG